MTYTKHLLPVILLTGLCTSAVFAQTPNASTAEQKAARAEIDQLTKRIEALSKQLGPDTQLDITIVERSDGNENRSVERRIISNSPDGKSMVWTDDGPNPIERTPRVGLGIVMAPNTEINGVKVAAVSPNGPAKAAGIQSGDQITSINGKALTAKNQAGLNQARAALANLKIGQPVKIGYTRAGKASSTTIKAGRIEQQMIINRDTRRIGPDIPPPPMNHATRWNGLNMATLNPELGRYFGTSTGALVLGPNPEIPQFKGGDVITQVAGKPVINTRDVLSALRSKKTGEKVPVTILRDRKPLSLSITVPKERTFNIPAPPRPPAPQSVPKPPVPPAPPAPPRTVMLMEDAVGPDWFQDAKIVDFADIEDGEGFNQINVVTLGDGSSFEMAFFSEP
jgi:hypothetical protein